MTAKLATLLTVVLPSGPDFEQTDRTLVSLDNQTFPSFEILVVDVGSPEAYLSKLRHRAESGRLRIVGAASSVPYAWIEGATYSTAKQICFLSPGDCLEETYLEKCLFYLEVLSFDVCGSRELRNGKLRHAGPFALSTLLDRNVSMPAAVIRSEAFQSSGGFDPAVPAESLVWDLWTRMAARGARGYLISEALVQNSREHAENSSADTQSIRTRYASLIRDPSLLRALDAERIKPAPARPYDGLLNGAREGTEIGVLIAAPFLAMGGSERALAAISRELTGRGLRIFVVTTQPLPPGLGDTTAWFQESVAGVFHLPRFLSGNLWPAFFCYLIQRHAIKVLLQAGSSWLYNFLPRMRELFPAIVVADLLFNPVGHTENYLKNRGLIDHVIVEHNGMRSWLMDRHERAERISIIPNGVDLERFSPQPPGHRLNETPAREGSFVVGFLGRLSEEKAPDTFIRIAARFRGRPDFQFLLCGTGPLEASLRSLARQSGVESNLRFVGFVSTLEYLPRCHLTVVCSRLDGRPNIVLESLAMGVPVIASRVGGIPEMAHEGEGIRFCEAGDVDGFCSAIEQMAADKSSYAQFAAKGREWAEEHFSWSGATDSYIGLFHRLIAERTALAPSPQSQSGISVAVLPRGPVYRVLPHGRLRAVSCWLRQNFNWRSLPGALRNAWYYCILLRTAESAGEFHELFDADYYGRQNQDVKASGIPLRWHYLLTGFQEGRDPSPFFDTDYYLGVYPDVAVTGLNPLVHYLLWGKAEGRSCLPA